MIETRLEIPTIATETLLLRPDDIGEFPGVIFLTDIWGIRPANIGVAKRLAEKGFAVLMPNVFHRYSRITPDGFEHGGEEEKMTKLHALFASLTAEQMVSDGKAYVDFLLAQKGVKPGKVGVVGYCFTGQMAVRTAAAVPDKVAAAASFHGGFLVTARARQPAQDSRAHQGASFISAMRSRTSPPRRSRSAPWKPPCATGTARSRAKSMKAPGTAGRYRAATSTTKCRPSGLSRNWLSCSRRRWNRCSEHRGNDAIRRLVAVGEGLDVDDHLLAHVDAAFDGGRAHMRQQHHILAP